ncbi:hypothetical protein llg_16760 [Luteolibacter sp. LG18]|nr:hypothetical protein llg_16760 [Luteolibacter sp. LG18]
MCLPSLLLAMAWGGVGRAATGPPPAVLKQLGAEDFKERQTAQDALLAWGRKTPKTALEWLYLRSLGEVDPEIRRRCTSVLRELVLDVYRQEGEGYVGILMQAVAVVVPGDPGKRFGVRVTFVIPGGPAAKAGIAAGELIVGAGDRVWRDMEAVPDFQRWIRGHKPGTKVTLKALRGNQLADVVVELDRRPPEVERMLPFGDVPDVGKLKQEAEDTYFKEWLEKRKARK